GGDGGGGQPPGVSGGPGLVAGQLEGIPVPPLTPLAVSRPDSYRHRNLLPSQETPMAASPRRSRLTTEGMGRAPNRAMLRAVGFHDDDFQRPMVGVASLYSDITPCNAHLDRLARKGCEGLRAAGAVGQIFGAPTASDGIMMGHQGMRYSLVSREVIADSIEIVAGGMNHD